MALTYGQLINPFPIKVQNDSGVWVRRPPIGEIYEKLINIEKERYNGYVGIFSSNVNSLIKAIKAEKIFDQASPEALKEITPYKIIISVPQLRELLEEALSFFICGMCKYNEKKGYFDVITSDEDGSQHLTGKIDEETFDLVSAIVLETNMLKIPSKAPVKYRNAKAREVYELIEKRRQEQQKSKKSSNENVSLDNLISAISANHNSYNYTNIWRLTVYEVYDAFFRQTGREQRLALEQRWAAWGKEPFDFSLWYAARENI